ncbi:MAG: MinD/ParA family protein [Lachnospiraceae bacterium]|nr:MinD/ParA family protein [Lachnospiraceae bacterium]MBQ8262076.1 MinD/ParA family protein [Lachnospiraceae bacterium]
MDQAQQLRNIVKTGKTKRPLARVITVTSGKGGVGKSNTAINLAIHMRKLGKRVIILDADFGLANIEIMFGTVPKHNLSDLIYKGKNIKEVITWGPGDVGFISGGSGIAGLSNLNREYLTYIIQNLAQLDAIADVIIIDTGAGISDAVLEFLVASGEIVLVTTLEPTSITDSYSLLKALKRHPRFKEEHTSIKVIANKVGTPEEGASLFRKLNAVVVRYLGLVIEYIGSVPQDQELNEAVMQQTPVTLANPHAKSARAYEDITAKLMNIEKNENFKKRGMAAFFSHLVANKKKDGGN